MTAVTAANLPLRYRSVMIWGLGNLVTMGPGARAPAARPAAKAPVLGPAWRGRIALAVLVAYAVTSYVRVRSATRRIR